MNARTLPVLVAIALTGGCNQPASRPLTAAITEASPAVRAATTLADASALYARAEHLLDCATLAEAAATAAEPPTEAAAASADPTRIDIDPAAPRRQPDTCAGLGPDARAQARRLLSDAAASGDGNAQVALLDQEADSLLGELAARARANSDEPAPMTPAERSQTELIIAGLEKQAFRGNRHAIDSLQQVLDSRVSALAEPHYAAAWRLVAEQPPGRALASGPLRGEAMLDDLDGGSKQQIVALARDLHTVCCSR